MTQTRNDISKLSALNFASTIFLKVLSVPNGIVVASFLGPQGLGHLALINLVIQYAGYTQLGFLRSLQYEVPLAQGRGDLEESRNISHIIHTNLRLAVLFSLVILWGLYFSGFRLKGVLDLGNLILVSLIIVAARMSAFFRAFSKATGQFTFFGIADIIQQLSYPLSSILLVIFLNLRGTLLAILIGHCCTVAYYLYALHWPRFNFVIHLRKSLHLLKSGSLIFINNTLDTILWNLSLLIIGVMRSAESVGIFAFSLTALNMVLTMAAGGVHPVIYRNMMLQAGRMPTSVGFAYRRYFQEPFVCYLMILQGITGLTTLFYIFLTHTFLAAYSASVPLMLILGFGYMVSLSRHLATFYLNATNQLSKRIFITAIILVLQTILIFLALYMNYSLSLVAIMTSVSFFILSLLVTKIAFDQIFADRRSGLFFLSKQTLIAGLLTATLWALNSVEIIPYSEMLGRVTLVSLGLLDCIVKAVIFGSTCAVSYFIFFRDSQLYPVIKPILISFFDLLLSPGKIFKKTSSPMGEAPVS